MEICLKFLPRKSYDKNGLFLLMTFVSTGVVLISIAGIFEAQTTLECNPDKKLASDVSTRKYIATQCFLKYAQEFYPPLPIYALALMNFGIVYLLSIIYAHLVEHRVKIFTEPLSARTDDGGEESLPLSTGNTAASADPATYGKWAGRYIVFTAYVTHLIVCRIIPLVVFAALLLASSSRPVQFQCHLPTKTTSTPPANFTKNSNSTVDCIYPMSNQNEILVTTVVTVNFVVGTVAFVELVYLLCSAWKDHNLLTDLEFCRVYLRKHKTIRELQRIIMKKIPKHLLQVHDDFGGKHLSIRRLKDMYINVIIQNGRQAGIKQCKNRHETCEAYLKKPKNATTLKNTADLLKSTEATGKNIYGLFESMEEGALSIFESMESVSESTAAAWEEGALGIFESMESVSESTTAAWEESALGIFESVPTSTADDPKRAKSVLVIGRPGIGKTFLTKMMLFEWQQQKSEFWYGKIVILIRFRCFNTGKTSLRNMLQTSDGLNGINISADDFTSIYEYICLNPSKVVLIFDGLDELRVDDDTLISERYINGNNEETHIFYIWKQLVRGQLLPGVTVLTTSRPTAENIYKPLLQCHKHVEILGFHKQQIKNYVRKFCGVDMKRSTDVDKQKSTKIWNLIKESQELLTLCYIPVSSYIVCLTLHESIKMNKQDEVDGQGNVPRKMTELYKRAINIFLFEHNSKYKGKEKPKNYITAKLPKELQDDLNKLKKIARNGMREEKLIFYNDEVDSAIPDCGLFNKLEDKSQNIFCFLHLTIQEFLAALDVVDDMDNVESFLSEHIEDPKWHLVILFVAGLIGDKFREMESQRYAKFVFHIF